MELQKQHYDVANSLLADVQSGKRAELNKKVNLLLSENALLGKLWGGVSRLSLTLGEVELAKLCAKRYYNALSTGESLIQYAGILTEVGDAKEALELLKSSKLNDGTFSKYYLLGVCYSQLGLFSEGRIAFKEAIRIAPYSGAAWLGLVSITEGEALIELSQELKNTVIANFKGAAVEKVQALYALSKSEEMLGNKQAAFEFADEASKLAKRNLVSKDYEIGNESAFTQKLKAFHDSHFFDTIKNQDVFDDFRPIFVLGLPRSGTTLLSETLGKHSDIDSGGELNICRLALLPVGLEQLVNSGADGKKPKVLNQLIMNLRNEYVYRAQLKLKSEVIVDKTLDLYRYVGLLAKAFPNARFIYIKRDAKDVAWSCYKHFFKSGLPWAYNLPEIKHFIDDHEDMMSHWLEHLSDRISILEYESLANNPEKEINALLTELGLEVNSGIAISDIPTSQIMTNSLLHARKPINKNFINTSGDIKDKFKIF